MPTLPHISDAPTPGRAPVAVPEGRGSKAKATLIKVNNREVTVPDDEVTGLQVKHAAIAAGLPIDVGFQLLLDEPNGRDRPISDEETVKVNRSTRFTAIAADDNS